jgi:aquaporin Z
MQSGILPGSQPILIKERAYTHDSFAKYVAEFVGTFFLVFTVGCNVHTGSIGAAISIGGILMVMVYALGPVSGGHLNPAVTVAIALSGRNKISFENMCCYILAQLAGGLFGAFHYWIIFNDAFLLRPLAGYSHHDAAWAEILYTMALCYVVLNVATTENREQGNVKSHDRIPNSFFGLAIGLTVTSAAIAVGPISGCSLNPAVSLGAMFACKMAHGIMPMDMVALYTLAPLFGACLATLFFYFVQGGLTGQYEYEMGPSRPASPVTSRPASPVIRYREPVPSTASRICKFLGRGEIFFIPEEVEHHTIYLGLSWKIQEGFTAVDIDASCVKFTSEGRMIEGIYFNNHEGMEDKKSGESIVTHQGDNLTGKGVGFGFLEDPNAHLKHGQVRVVKDDERVEIRHLAKLRRFQPRCTYMFFVINVFSAANKFEHMKDLTIRIVDQDANHSEICRFEKKDMVSNKFNGFVLGVLFWRMDRWVFQVVDEAFDIKEHGTYRDFEPKLRKIVRTMEGWDDRGRV